MQTNTYLEGLRLCYGKGSCSVSFSKIKIFYMVPGKKKKKGSFHAVKTEQTLSNKGEQIGTIGKLLIRPQ